ncbi:MAG: molecular chaperone DnaJ [Acidimicrobiales bacterium]
MADYYALLGVDRGATPDEIKRSYRALALKLHPDTNPDPSASAQFKEIAVAYETLSDPERRARYDRYGPEGAAGAADPFGFGGGGGLGDLFDAFFGGQGGGGRQGGPPRGTDLEVVAEIDFEVAVFGGQEPIAVRTAVACEVCQASGAEPGSHPTTCGDCGGAGQVRRVRQSILGQMVTAGPCQRCNGMGQIIPKPCPTCRGEGRQITDKTYTVDIPAGVDTGSTLRLGGRGAAGIRGGGFGDLYVHVKVRSHQRFARQGYDIVHELHVPFTQAALGAHLRFETLDGTEDLVVPRGTQTGRVFRLRGRGVPHLEGRGRGDLLVQVVVDTPDELGRDEEDLLRQIAVARGEEVAPADTGFLSKIRSAFR